MMDIEQSTGLGTVSNYFDIYVLGYYWTIVTITSVGYGDLTP